MGEKLLTKLDENAPTGEILQWLKARHDAALNEMESYRVYNDSVHVRFLETVTEDLIRVVVILADKIGRLERKAKNGDD